MLTILAAGQLITRFGASILVYQVAFGICFLIGMASTYSYARLREPDTHKPGGAQTYTLKALLVTLKGDPNFLAYCIYTVVWNFSLNIAGPFFTVYQVQTLKASAFMIGLVSIVSSLSGLPGQRIFGQLADRWGPRKVMLVTGWLIPVMPFFWYLTRQAWHAIPINLVAGFLWAGYGLASFNFLLAISSEENRAKYSAMAQIAVTLSAAAGASVGGLAANQWGIPAVFLISAVGRAVAAGVFTRFVQGSQPTAPRPALPDDQPDETDEPEKRGEGI
jgi:predicted MFS family arabinose efflux permease